MILMAVLIPTIAFCWVILSLVFYVSLKKYQAPNKKLALASVLMSGVSGFVLNLELEGGLIEVPIQVCILSIFWAFVILLSYFIYKFLKNGQGSNANNT